MALQLRGGPVVGCHFEFWTRCQRKVRGFNDCVIEFKAREDGEDARRRRFCSIRGFVCVSQPLLAQGEWAKKGRDQALKGGQLLRMLLSWMVEKPLLLLPSRVVTAICRPPFFFFFWFINLGRLAASSLEKAKNRNYCESGDSTALKKRKKKKIGTGRCWVFNRGKRMKIPTSEGQTPILIGSFVDCRSLRQDQKKTTARRYAKAKAVDDPWIPRSFS